MPKNFNFQEMLVISDDPDPRDLPTLDAADPWIASSLLQKAIRRGETPTAQAAALRLFRLRGSAIWRRLMVIAFEDTGVGSIGTLVCVVAAGIDAKVRTRAGGDERVMLGLVRMLADAPKDRSADYLISAAGKHPEFKEERELCCGLNLHQRLNRLTDTSLSQPARTVAALFASGMEGVGGDRVKPGHLMELMGAYQSLGVPSTLIEATRIAVTRTRETICLMVPMIWLAIPKTDAHQILDCPVPVSPVINDVPMYALGHHTRIGKAAIRQFCRESTEVRTCLETHVPDFRSHGAACLGAFYADAAPVSRRLHWSGSATMETLGIEADMLRAGVPLTGIDPILSVFRENLDHLNDVRARLFTGRQS